MALIKRGGVRAIRTFVFAAGARQEQELQVPARYLQRLWCMLRGTLTISAVTVPGDVHADGPSNVVANVELKVDGKSYKVGRFSAFLRTASNYFRTEGWNNGLIGGGAGVYDFECLVPLMFEATGTVSPLDTLIDGRGVKNITLTITWGVAGDLLVGETSTLALTNTTLDIYMEDTDPFPVDAPFWVFRQSETTHAPIVTSNQTRLPINYQPRSILRFIQLRAIDGDNLSDDVINQLTLRINGEERPYSELEDDFQQARLVYEYGLQDHPDGYYHVELVEQGRVFTTGLGSNPAIPINDVDIVADTTVGAGATSIVTHIGEHAPPDSSALAIAGA